MSVDLESEQAGNDSQEARDGENKENENDNGGMMGFSLFNDDFEDDSNDNDNNNDEMDSKTALYMMSAFWMNEKNAPEILEYESDVVDTIKKMIKERENYIYDKMDQLQSNNNNNDNDNDNNSNSNIDMQDETNTKFEQYCLNLFKQELQRIEYVLFSYLRIRLLKIQKQCIYILQTPAMMNRLSSQEQLFAKNYFQLTQNHLKGAFLSQLPQKFQNITEPEMVDKPNVNKHIVMRVNEPIGNFIYDENKDVDLQQGSIFIGKYKDFHSLIYDGTIDAI